MPRTKMPSNDIPVVIVPKDATASIRVCTETQQMVNDLARFYGQRVGYRISANSVVHLLAQNALQELAD